ncbi:MAG: translation initiation factor IF-1 [Verrucomicrobiota bacterium]
MPAPNPIHTIGTILEAAGPRVYRTALPNGKEILAHVPFKRAAALDGLPAQTRVKLEMTAYDFSTGRITGIEVSG